MRRILTATDGSTDGQAALHWATGLATATGAELVVVQAWTPRTSELPPGEFDDLTREALDRLDDEWCTSVRAAGVDYRALVREGDPRDQVLACADDEDADLVVVGARGTGGRHHALHLGSVTHHLVHHTRRPLATIPPSSRTTWPTPVVVGLDGSDSGARALEWAIGLAGDVGGEVFAVYADRPPAEFVPHDDPKSWYHGAVEALEEWVGPYLDRGVAIERIVVDEAPGPGLADVADRERAGLVVTGARGLGAVTSVRLGSTALKVLHHSGQPVVIVP